MTNIYPLPRKDEVQAAAAAWVAALDRGLTEQEEQQLQDWLLLSSAHREAMNDMAEHWQSLNVLSRLAALFPEAAPARTKSPRTSAWFAGGMSVAALGLLMVMMVAFWQSQLLPVDPIGGERLMTQVGERTNVRLDDGSQLTLNTDTEIELRFSAAYRDIVLHKGELHIQVAKDKQRPLRVFSNDKVVQAVGTAFNVELLAGGDVELVVTEGEVTTAKLEKPLGRLRQNASAIEKPLLTSVKPGKRIVLKESRPLVQPLAAAELQSVLGWQRGELIFRGEPLSMALKEVERYTDKKLIIGDGNIADVKIAGLFRTGDVKGLLASLEKNFAINSRYVDADTIELYQ